MVVAVTYEATNYTEQVVIFGRPFVKRFAVCCQIVVSPVLSVCDIGVVWPNSLMDQDET